MVAVWHTPLAVILGCGCMFSPFYKSQFLIHVFRLLDKDNKSVLWIFSNCPIIVYVREEPTINLSLSSKFLL